VDFSHCTQELVEKHLIETIFNFIYRIQLNKRHGVSATCV